MKFIVYFLLLGFGLLSCKRELSQEERDKLHQDSINQKILAMGMNADSSFSIKKYQHELKKFNDSKIKKDSNLFMIEVIPMGLAPYQIIFYDDNLIYFYQDTIQIGRLLCGTEALQNYNEKKFTEIFKMNKNDLTEINKDSLILFLENIRISRNNKPFSIDIAINKDPFKNNSLSKLRKYLSETDLRYTYRPLSTRERLVADAKFKNTSEDFSKINWDSAYHVDFRKFYPEN
ncbi:MAG TPA: hypothetical protein DEQ26_04485 [Flavobacteriaceae bacterium]|nr:hypothetical protein [Flavobacteriaceae bacterium]